MTDLRMEKMNAAPLDKVMCCSIPLRTPDGKEGWFYGVHIIPDKNCPDRCPTCNCKLNSGDRS